nr:MAG: hypothetical protein DIU81_08860 [[Clostridium] cellulosi]
MITLQRRGIVDEYRQFSFSRASTAFDSRGRLYHPHNARFETIAGRTGVLVEEGTTNLLLRSEEFDNTVWGKSNSTIIANVITAPNGTNTSYKIVSGNVGKNYIGVQQSVTFSNTIYTFTVYAKAGEVRWLRLGLTSYNAWFDLQSGVLGTVDLGATAAIKYVGNGWYLCSLTATIADGSGFVYIRLADSNGDLRFTGDGTSGLYLWGAQLEQKPYATSWTPGGTTRAAEKLTVPTAGLLDPREGTIELWINPSFVASWNNFFHMSINTGRFLLFFNSYGAVAWDFGTVNDPIETGTNVAIAGQWLHVAMRWSVTTGTRELFVNGQKIGSKPFTPPTGFPSTVNVVDNYSAYIDDLRISNIARSDAEIAAYNSGQLQADQYTTLLLNFNGPDAQRAAKTVVI